MNRPYPQHLGRAPLFRFPGSEGLSIRSIEDSLRRAFQRSQSTVAMGVADWHRGASLGVLAAAPEFELSRLLPIFVRVAQLQHETSMIATGVDAIDDVVVDTHRGRVVVRLVRGTSLLVWALVPGTTACCEGARTELRGLALEFGGVVPHVRSGFDA